MWKYEISVRPVTRFIITEWHESEDGGSAGCQTLGEFHNREMANEMAQARGALRREAPTNQVCVRPLVSEVSADGENGPRTIELKALPMANALK